MYINKKLIAIHTVTDTVTSIFLCVGHFWCLLFSGRLLVQELYCKDIVTIILPSVHCSLYYIIMMHLSTIFTLSLLVFLLV
jgi:lipid-A-disaccharide synthase-like uncharacterized protein